MSCRCEVFWSSWVHLGRSGNTLLLALFWSIRGTIRDRFQGKCTFADFARRWLQDVVSRWPLEYLLCLMWCVENTLWLLVLTAACRCLKPYGDALGPLGNPFSGSGQGPGLHSSENALAVRVPLRPVLQHPWPLVRCLWFQVYHSRSIFLMSFGSSRIAPTSKLMLPC